MPNRARFSRPRTGIGNPPDHAATPAAGALSVVLAIAQPVLQAGLRTILAAGGVAVAAATSDLVALSKVLRDVTPDVVLVDEALLEGATAPIRLLTGTAGRTLAVVVINLTGAPGRVQPLLHAGAAGYLSGNCASPLIIQAIRTAAAGGTVLSADAAQGLSAIPAPAQRAALPLPPELTLLSRRELTVLGLVAQGMSNSAIAGELYVTEATIKCHVSRVLDKLGLRNRTAAAIYADRLGLGDLAWN